MAVTALTQIKNWFLTGLKPTQTQFHNTWDSFWHKDDSIPQASVTNLVQALADIGVPEEAIYASNGSFVIAEGRLLEYLVITSDTNQNISIGSTLSGTEMIEAEVFTIGNAQVFQLLLYGTGQTVYLTHSGQITVKKYFR